MRELVTVVVASYNYERFLSRTLESIRSQTWTGWEALVVDDGSSDGSVDLIRRFSERDRRFRLLQHVGGANEGLGATLQLGIRSASGEWIAFCESDDWWEPGFLQRLSEAAAAHPECGVLFSDVVLEGSSPTMEAHCVMVREHFRRGARAVDLYHAMSNAVPTMSCAMVRAALIRNCDFNARFPPSLDMWLWAQLAARTEFRYVDLPLCHWRQHETSYMKQEVDPARLDMNRVLAFHEDIRGLLPPPAPQPRHPGVLQRLKRLFHR